MHWNHGTIELATPFGCTSDGMLIGLIRGRAPFKEFLGLPLVAVPIFFISALLWSLLVWALLGAVFQHHFQIRSVPLEEIVSCAFFLLMGVLSGLGPAQYKDGPNHKRGTNLGTTPSRPSRNLARDQRLTLAGHPVAYGDETKHFKLMGTTGTGKSTAIRELLRGALARGDRAVIADPDGSYLERFYDPKRGDVILNPFDPRAARWNLFAEMQTAFDANQLSQSLIADTEGVERNWRDYVRVFLTSVLRQFHRVKHHDVAELYQLLSTTPIEDLRDLLSDTPSGPYLAQDNGKFFGAVRAVSNTHLAALEHIAAQRSANEFSVRNWVRNRREGGASNGRVLFLPYRANEIATLRTLISTWLRLAVFETMSQPAGDQRLWFVVDELDALGQIDGLKDALAILRKFGGRCVLGCQSVAQVSGTYGHAEAQTIVEYCGSTVILRCSASENGGTAKFASRLIGEREVIREQVTHGRSGGAFFANDHRSVSTSFRRVTESAVLASEIEQLPDLQGYLKFASTPAWRRVQLRVS